MEDLKLLPLSDGTSVPIETDADLPLANPKEPIEGPQERRQNHAKMSKGWSEMDKAFLLKHWKAGTGIGVGESQREVARNLQRTHGACAQMHRIMMQGGHQNGVQKSTGRQRMVAANSENLTFAEQQEIIQLFGSFTPEIRAIILSLRGYQKPRISFFDYEKHKMEVEFFPPM